SRCVLLFKCTTSAFASIMTTAKMHNPTMPLGRGVDINSPPGSVSDLVLFIGLRKAFVIRVTSKLVRGTRASRDGGPDDLEGILGLVADRTWIQCACFGDRSIVAGFCRSPLGPM